MARSRYEVIDGKARFDGRPLAAWADDVTARIFERTEATKIVVVGSTQRGDDGPDSDLDLLVILPTVTRHHDDAVRVLRELRDLPIPIDVSVTDENTFGRNADVPGFIRTARSQGRLVQRST